MKNAEMPRLVLYGWHDGRPWPLEVAPDGGLRLQLDLQNSLDHGTLLGLADDDHTQYLILAGRGGAAQTVEGGLILNGTVGILGLDLRNGFKVAGGSSMYGGLTLYTGTADIKNGMLLSGGLTFALDSGNPGVDGMLKYGIDSVLRAYMKNDSGGTAQVRRVMMVPNATPNARDILIWDGTNFDWATAALSGDVTFVNPGTLGTTRVNGFCGASFGAGTPAAKQIIVAADSTLMRWVDAGGDITLANEFGSFSVDAVKGVVVSGSAAADKALVCTTGATAEWKYVTNIGGVSVSGTAADGKIIKASSASAASWVDDPATTTTNLIVDTSGAAAGTEEIGEYQEWVGQYVFGAIGNTWFKPNASAYVDITAGDWDLTGCAVWEFDVATNPGTISFAVCRWRNPGSPGLLPYTKALDYVQDAGTIDGTVIYGGAGNVRCYNREVSQSIPQFQVRYNGQEQYTITAYALESNVARVEFNTPALELLLQVGGAINVSGLTGAGADLNGNWTISAVHDGDNKVAHPADTYDCSVEFNFTHADIMPEQSTMTGILTATGCFRRYWLAEYYAIAAGDNGGTVDSRINARRVR